MSKVISTISRDRRSSPRHLHIVQVAKAIQTIISVPRASDLSLVRPSLLVPTRPPCPLHVFLIGRMDKDAWHPRVTRETRTKLQDAPVYRRRQGARPKATLARANRDTELMSHGETAIRFLLPAFTCIRSCTCNAAYFRLRDGLAHHRDKDGNRESNPPILSFLITLDQPVCAAVPFFSPRFYS